MISKNCSVLQVVWLEIVNRYLVVSNFSVLTQASSQIQCVSGGLICPEVEELNRHSPWQDEPSLFVFP